MKSVGSRDVCYQLFGAVHVFDVKKNCSQCYLTEYKESFAKIGVFKGELKHRKQFSINTINESFSVGQLVNNEGGPNHYTIKLEI